jgi:hypothetical protein
VPDGPDQTPLLRRRPFLLATGGIVVAGVVGAARVGERGWDRLTRDCGPPPADVPPGGWDVQRGTLTSQHVEGPVGWVVARPPETPTGLVIVLPGRGNVAADVVDRLRFHDRAAAERSTLALASVDAGQSYWHPRASGEDRMSMLVDDLAPLAAEQAGVAEPLGRHGWSWGGYGALLAAAEQRLPVRAVATSAAALWTSQAEQADAVGDAFDGPDDYAAHDVLGRAGGLATPVRIACGRSDPFYSANRALAGALPAPTLPEAEPSFPDGCHDERFWQVAFPGHLAFFRTALA